MAVAMLSSPGLTRRVLRLLARRRTPAFAPHWMMIPAALAVMVAFASAQISLVGVELTTLRAIDSQLVLNAPAVPVAATLLARTRTAVAQARQQRVQPTPVAARAEPEGREPEAGSPGPDVQQAATNPAVQIEETMPMPLASSAMPTTVSQPPAVVPAATVEHTTVTGEAKQAWAAATQAGESIGLSSRKGAVATAGFFTRLSKKVATSF